MVTSIGIENQAITGHEGWSGRAVPTGERSPSLRQAGTGGLVARDRELAYLDRALLAARRGVSDVMLLRGEPGTGKSSLIQAAIGRAREVRQVVLQGKLYAEGSTLSAGWPQPLVELLGHFENAGSVWQGESSLSPAIEALRSVAGGGLTPLLLSIDDCHLLPPGFTETIVRAVDSQSLSTPIVLMVATSTPARSLFEAGQVGDGKDQDQDISAFDLAGLNLKQAQALLRLRCDRIPVPRVILDLVQATSGNPEALIDVCNNLTTEERTGLCALPDPLPLGLALVSKFSQRFDELPGPTKEALCVVAAGRIPFEILTLALAGMGLAQDALRSAHDAGLLTVSRDRIEFSYAIERSAVYWLSSDTTRSRAHQAVSNALLDQGSVELGAYHATRHAVGHDDNVARLHLHAARVALDRGSPEVAAEHHKVASDYAESTESTAHHLVIAASLLVTVGQIDRALAYLDRASQLDPSDHLRGEAMYFEARARLSSNLDPEIASEMLAAADLCKRDATDWALLMLVDAATCLLATGSLEQGRSIAERARALARAVGAHGEALADAALAIAADLTDSANAPAPGLLAAIGHLVAETDRFSATPQLGWLAAASLLRQGNRVEALRWAGWIEQCADNVGDRVLAAVPDAIRGMVALDSGQFEAAIEAAEASVSKAAACGNQTLAAQGLGLLARACAARGRFDRGFAVAAKLFSLTEETGPGARIEVLVALAALELQKGRIGSSFAWLRAASDELSPVDGSPPFPPNHQLWIEWGLSYVELVILARADEDVSSVVQAMESARGDTGIVHPSWTWWIRGMVAGDVAGASGCFEQAAALAATPLAAARIDLSWGVRLSEGGLAEEASQRLGLAQRRFHALEADGWERVADRELQRLPRRPRLAHAAENTRMGSETEPGRPELALVSSTTAHPEWEITLFGAFEVRHRGRPVSLPLSLAAQTLKIVALRKRIPVDELVELLWPEAHPGVGNRRLRNVLWRNRASCGDLLYRDGNFICLAKAAVVDADLFRAAAERAIAASDTPPAAALVREALDLYPGELLPGDHYVDWPTASRESLARLAVSLLDLLLDRATEEGQTHEALACLDRLIEADPYEERHYLRAATLHAGSGNVNRALASLTRAERTLSDLGVPPSAAIQRARSNLEAMRRAAAG